MTLRTAHKINTKEISPELVGRIREGDVSAYKLVFTTWWNPLLNFANRIVKDVEQSENILQDTFLYIWENRSKLNPDQNLKTYLFTTVRNKSLNHLRSSGESKKSDEDIAEIEDDRSIHAGLENLELGEAVKKAVNKLPDKCKEIFELSRYDNLTYREISETLGISQKTIEAQMSRAYRKLRALLAHLITFIFFLKML